MDKSANYNNLLAVMTDVLVAFGDAGGNAADALEVMDFLAVTLEEAIRQDAVVAENADIAAFMVNSYGEA